MISWLCIWTHMTRTLAADIAHPWDSDVEEYENAAEELILPPEDEEGHDDQEKPEGDGDHHHEEGSQSSGTRSCDSYVISGSATPSGGYPSPPSRTEAATGDESWDLGPADIKIADPVTTPTKSTSGEIGEIPPLSRVPSLGDSFKQGTDDEASNADTADEAAGQELGESSQPSSAIDLSPSLPQAYLPEYGGLFDHVMQMHASQASSVDAVVDEGSVDTSQAEMSSPKALRVDTGVEG
jgi:hypothetical protein